MLVFAGASFTAHAFPRELKYGEPAEPKTSASVQAVTPTRQSRLEGKNTFSSYSFDYKTRDVFAPYPSTGSGYRIRSVIKKTVSRRVRFRHLRTKAKKMHGTFDKSPWQRIKQTADTKAARTKHCRTESLSESDSERDSATLPVCVASLQYKEIFVQIMRGVP